MKKVLVSGASIAGLATAYWMDQLGYKVTVVEVAPAPRTGGTAVDLRLGTIDILKRMEIYDQVKSNALNLELIEFKNAADETVGSFAQKRYDSDEEIEIERTILVDVLYNVLKDKVNFLFDNSITALQETSGNITATFKDASQVTFDLVLGCDGTHSNVRKIWFGPESDYAHFLNAYFSISIVEKSLVAPNTVNFYNTPGKAYMLNAYKNKTDVIFCFAADDEMEYDYRDVTQQRNIILEQFKGQQWRTGELLTEVANSDNFYFDKFCQIKMPSWKKGRVALVGDAAYCASPAAGMGGSLALDGAAALADALKVHGENYMLAFQDYENNLRPFIEGVQAEAEINAREKFIPRTQEAIDKRNMDGF
ncbi:FAD-dependent monooxygenase [Chitinophaga sancti]|uniref:2-polyprenyl-6-methoxyphenol hydroxylase n=1 Tax=Chitinophaga sancti TaxID=1004 RepID=A0A1K1RAQ7_9BACT|nr:FAD-dependent monooxygenase [Chitinophaga sancti]WQD65536.1 FAD-dependent monooxygenase [Chitinophaga sancti]WQG88841.1 FAD-dependent monooxygenase [Chitinophaga sancti]SFW69017.1 2-polyprenyl-6-methoxyphenol hydroxylase [Chitinophaga sancti]